MVPHHTASRPPDQNNNTAGGARQRQPTYVSVAASTGTRPNPSADANVAATAVPVGGVNTAAIAAAWAAAAGRYTR